MTKQSAYAEIQQIYEDTRMEIRIAAPIAGKVVPLLPEHWESSFVIGGWRGLHFGRFSYDGGHPVEEFKYVCKLIEIATGMKMEKEPWVSGESLIALQARLYYPMTNGDVSHPHHLTIQVRLYDTRECKLSFKEKTVREPSLLDDCLGATEG